MKRFLVVFFSVLLMLSFVGCGQPVSDPASNPENSSSASASFFLPSEEGYIAGDGPGFHDGRSEGFEAGESAGMQNAFPPFDDEGTYEDGYTFGYGKAYAQGWLNGYISGYLSQHPEINEYDLIDNALSNFPDSDISDMIDYLHSSQ